jgi:hypothetical protein
MQQVSRARIGQPDRDRVEVLYEEQLRSRHVKGDQMFAALMVAQWVFAIVLALHPHLYAAVFMGAGLTLFPVLLVRYRPGAAVTRHVLVGSQMLWSALFIHLTGGRIETHFHVFVSLAFAAVYLDWKVLVTATLVVAGDHLARGMIFPESVYGIANPAWWRFLEHAAWVVFEDVVLIWSCVNGLREMKAMAVRQAELELVKEREEAKTAALEMVLKELQPSPAA